MDLLYSSGYYKRWPCTQESSTGDFAVSGIITFNTEDRHGNKERYILDHPSKGLYIPNLIWRDIHFTHNAVLLCLASECYIEDDYFRDYQEFKTYKS